MGLGGADLAKTMEGREATSVVVPGSPDWSIGDSIVVSPSITVLDAEDTEITSVRRVVGADGKVATHLELQQPNVPPWRCAPHGRRAREPSAPPCLGLMPHRQIHSPASAVPARRRALSTDAFTFYVIALWVLCGLYAEFIETPIATLVPKLWSWCTQSTADKLEKMRR